MEVHIQQHYQAIFKEQLSNMEQQMVLIHFLVFLHIQMQEHILYIGKLVKDM